MNTLDGPDKPNPTADRYGINRMKQSESQKRKSGNRPVSRVLSRTVVHLRCPSPDTCSDLPGSYADRIKRPLFGLASGGVYRAAPVASRAVRSYRTFSPLPVLANVGGLFSVALSVGLRRPGVTWHPVL